MARQSVLRPQARPTQKNILTLRPRFSVLCTLWRSPVLVSVSVLFPLLLLPELLRILGFFGFGTGGGVAVVFGTVFIVIFLPILISGLLDCSYVRYRFYEDHMTLAESFFYRDEIEVPYRAIRAARVERSLPQRFSGLGDIVLEAESMITTSRKQAGQVLQDVRQSAKAAQKIEQILAQFRACDTP